MRLLNRCVGHKICAYDCSAKSNGEQVQSGCRKTSQRKCTKTGGTGEKTEEHGRCQPTERAFPERGTAEQLEGTTERPRVRAAATQRQNTTGDSETESRDRAAEATSFKKEKERYLISIHASSTSKVCHL